MNSTGSKTIAAQIGEMARRTATDAPGRRAASEKIGGVPVNGATDALAPTPSGNSRSESGFGEMQVDAMAFGSGF